MNFDRSLIFSYLEEDNIQRAYFRVRPLLTLDGDVRQESVQLWPNEGGLRIVPDRNEQHTFKVRMRNLGAYCVVDLRDQPAEAGKIRTNKNFRPERGEVNQYILYSDTVHELPENTFYQLIDGNAADYAVLAEQAITPLFFIREGDTLYGPVRKAAPAQPETAPEAACMLFELPCPDSVTRLMLCMDDGPAKAVAAEEPAKTAEDNPKTNESPAVVSAADTSVPVTSESADPSDEALPIGQALQILDESKSTEDTLKQLDKPVSSGANLLHHHEQKSAPELSAPAVQNGALSGTPLVRTPLHVSVQQNKNRTQEVVSSQWSIGKYEPPAQNLPTGATMRQVKNPVEAACSQLREAWNASSAHDQLTDFILSLDGVRTQLEAKLCKGSNVTIMQRVLRERLQDLEAERLTALCELDKARRDVDAYKQELINSLAARINRETGALEADKQKAESLVSALKSEINSLTLQRDALLAKVNELQSDVLPETLAKQLADAQMYAPASGVPLRLSPISGAKVEAEELISRLMATFAASGVEMDRNTSIAILVLLGISARIGVACPTPAPAATLIKNIAAAMGWHNSYAHQFSAEQRPVVGVQPIDGTPAILTTSLANYAPVSGLVKLTLNRNTANLIRNAAYDVSQWPVLMVPALPFVAELDVQQVTPISAASVAEFSNKSAAASAELDAVLSPILKAALPLGGPAQKELYRFISACTAYMEGGLPVAVDWGIALWVVPSLERGSRHYNAVKALLDEYPLSLSKL